MLPEEGETPDVEDINSNADDNQSETGHEEPASDESDDLDREGDEGGGADDDLSDDDAGADEGQAGQPHQVSGRRTASDEIRALRARAQAAERERDEARQAQQERDRHQYQQTAEQKAAERRARLELMTPEEKTEFLVNEARQETQSAIAQLRFEQADGRDRIAFESLCARKPHMARLADRVEEELVKMRRNGASAPRETIALYLIGRDADAKASKASGQQRRRGEENIRRQGAKPSGRGSNVEREDSRSGGSDRAARAKRLEKLTI